MNSAEYIYIIYVLLDSLTNHISTFKSCPGSFQHTASCSSTASLLVIM